VMNFNLAVWLQTIEHEHVGGKQYA
jgi:hypothetical protein